MFKNERYKSNQERQCRWPLASHCSGETVITKKKNDSIT